MGDIKETYYTFCKEKVVGSYDGCNIFISSLKKVGLLIERDLRPRESSNESIQIQLNVMKDGNYYLYAVAFWSDFQ